MFFILSKTAGVLLRPSVTIMVIGLIGLLLLRTRWRRGGLRLMVTSFVLLLVVGVSPLADMLTHVLESRFPKWDAARGAPDGIIVLGGALSPYLSQRHGEPIVGEDVGRILAIGKLARDYPQARIVYSGGNGSLLGAGGSEAEYLQPLLATMGVDAARVILEPRSRNTAENAAFTHDLVKPKLGERWLLVTSALHMPRSIGSFRRAGFAVEAYPVAWRTDVTYRFSPSVGVSGNLGRLDGAANEYVGLLAYWLAGRTSELWPAP